MAHEANTTPEPAPHADLAMARDCDVCYGWGTVVTEQGCHVLCLTCQRGPRSRA